MLKSRKKSECHVSVDLEEPLTGHACTQFIIELVKYVGYQKQQIPLSFDALKILHANTKPTDRNFSNMQHWVDTLSNISNQLDLQFTLDETHIKEVLILFGATTFSPKLCIIVELPPIILNSNVHLEYQHCYRKPLLTLMKSILESVEFQNEMTTSLSPTNTFVLIHKKDPYKISEFFIPKTQFSLSSLNTTSFRLRLNYDESNQLNCNCETLVKVHRESSNEDYLEKRRNVGKYESQIDYHWYQSKEILRGFKYR